MIGMGLHSLRGKSPKVDASAFVAEGAQLIGDVRIGPGASVWFNSVLRADMNYIEVGAGSNIQDGSVVHCDVGEFQTVIGENVTIGHGAIIHGCRLGANSLIGMGAVIMNGALVGEGSLVAAGAIIPEGRAYPPGSMIMGIPGKVVRQLSAEEQEGIKRNVRTYQSLMSEYRAEGVANQLGR